MTQYSPRMVTNGMVYYVDAANNKSYPNNDLPVKTGCILHLDAADDTTFAYSTSSLVKVWFDKSGNANHVTQSTTALQPTRTGTQNGLNTLVFASDALTSERQILKSTADYTKIAVVKQTSSGTSGNIIGKSTGGNNTFWYGGTTSIRLYHNSVTFLASSITTSLNSWSVNTGIFGATDRSASIYVNGALGAITSSATPMTEDSDVQIGAFGGGNHFIGEISEILIYNRVLNSEELRRVHTYLGQKWGITNSDRSWFDLTKTITGSTFVASGTGTSIGDIIYNESPPYFRLPQVITGSSKRYDLPTTTNLLKAAAGTIEMVGRFAYTAGGTNTFLFNAVGTGTNRFYIRGIVAAGPTYYLDCYRGAVVSDGFILSSNVGLNTWFHVAMSWNASTMFGYLNGNLVNSKGYTNASDPTLFYVGGAGDVEMCFPGDIGLCRIYNRKLLDSEILSNYETLKSRFI